jgi:hypothetical protein
MSTPERLKNLRERAPDPGTAGRLSGPRPTAGRFDETSPDRAQLADKLTSPFSELHTCPYRAEGQIGLERCQAARDVFELAAPGVERWWWCQRCRMSDRRLGRVLRHHDKPVLAEPAHSGLIGRDIETGSVSSLPQIKHCGVSTMLGLSLSKRVASAVSSRSRNAYLLTAGPG